MSLLHRIALTYIKNIGPTLAKSMLAYFGDAQSVFNATETKLLKVPGIGAKTIAQLDFDEALEKAALELKFVEQNNINVVFYTDAAYPKRLKNCADSPVLLFSKGNTNFNNQRIISIVGTRNATDYGKQLCHQLIEELQPYGVLVVSGLAHGIDVAAHKKLMCRQ